MNLARFPRRRYTAGPTPIEPMPHLTAHLGGAVDLWIKRDDLLGLAGGGNKTRKLEFLVADALAKGADTLVTVGAPQSNHCRLTLAAAVREGLKCRLVIEERVPGSYRADASGNNLLFDLMGVEKITVVAGGSNLGDAMAAELADLVAAGRLGYAIPGGGSNPRGALGYVACAEELLAQSFEHGVAFDHVVVASGSAGTHAGLVVGLERRQRRFAGDRDQRPPPAGRTGGQCPRARRGDRDLRRGAADSPRGGHLPRSLGRPRLLAADAGDDRRSPPARSDRGRAARPGLYRQGDGRAARPRPRGYFARGSRVIFLHTGGSPALFAYRDILA